MNWEPAHADHAIDNVTMILEFIAPLSANTFDELVLAARKAGEKHGLTDRAEFIEPIEVANGGFIRVGGGVPAPRRVVFREMHENRNIRELSVGLQNMTVATYRYRRWEDFYALTQDIIREIGVACPTANNFKVARLQYLDRFESNSEADDYFEVVDRNSQFIVGSLREKTSAFHVHSGWFDAESERVRKLTNVNIDSAEFRKPEGLRRRITVLTMVQYQAISGILDEPLQRLERLHRDLKTLIEGIITHDAANRVSLNG